MALLLERSLVKLIEILFVYMSAVIGPTIMLLGAMTHKMLSPIQTTSIVSLIDSGATNHEIYVSSYKLASRDSNLLISSTLHVSVYLRKTSQTIDATIPFPKEHLNESGAMENWKSLTLIESYCIGCIMFKLRSYIVL